MKTHADVNNLTKVTDAPDGTGVILHIAAHASLQALYDAPQCPALLREALSGGFSWQHRVDISIQQALLSPNLAPSWVAGLLALDARLVFNGDSEVEISLADFLPRTVAHQGPMETLRIPVKTDGRVWGAAQVARMPADEPIVSAIAVVDMADGIVEQARIALTGVSQQFAYLAAAGDSLSGAVLDAEHIEEIAGRVREQVSPVGDFRGSATYRQEMAAVLTYRALEECQKGM